MEKAHWEDTRSSVEPSCLWPRTRLRLNSRSEFTSPTLSQDLEWCVPFPEHLPFCEAWNMTTSSHTCPVPAVNGHMTHYPAAPYPLLFPPVIGGLSLPPLHGLHGHPPPSGCSTPSPASKYHWTLLFFSWSIGLMDLRKQDGSYPGWVLILLALVSLGLELYLYLSAEI